MAYEVFDKKTAGRSPVPTMTVQRGGTFSLNVAAVNLLRGEEKLTEIPVELLYDLDRKAIALRRTEPKTHTYFVRRQKTSESYLVSGAAFCQHYKLDTSISKRYIVSQVADGMIEIVLTAPALSVTRGSVSTN